MANRIRDLSAEPPFGLLTALSPTEARRGRNVVWRCLCACGRVVDVPGNWLVSGNTQSCGCLQPAVASKLATARHRRNRERKSNHA